MHLQCNSDFINKIEVRYNIVPPTCNWQSIVFELILIFVFDSSIQKKKVLRLSFAVTHTYIYMYIGHMLLVHLNSLWNIWLLVSF